MFCKNCGAEIMDEAVMCPKCGVMTDGTKAEPPKQEAPVPQSYPFNVIALIGFIFSFLYPIPGLICSIIGRKESQKLGGNGEAFAKAGLIISIVELSISVLAVISVCVLSVVYVAIMIAMIGSTGAPM